MFGRNRKLLNELDAKIDNEKDCRESNRDDFNRRIREERRRINMLVGLLLQILPRKTLKQKMKKGLYLNDEDIKEYPTVEKFLEGRIDP